MFQSHPMFREPLGEAKIWRYMDFTKFVSLLNSKSLFFSRADKFEDPFEGSWPRRNISARQQLPSGISPQVKDAFMKGMENVWEWSKRWPKHTAINCWHLNEHESAAMWKLYLKSDEGIAVQSHFNLLRDSISYEEPVFIGAVQYIDYDSDIIPDWNTLSPFVAQEKELRTRERAASTAS